MASVPAEAVLAVLKQLSHDIRDLDVGTGVDRHQKLPVVQFLRDYVAANKPVVLTGVVSHWPAYSNWTDEYLCQLAGDTEVTVALTPNGRADAVTPLPPPAGAVAPGGGGGAATGGGVAGGGGGGGAHCPSSHCFALPHQVKMPLRDFLALLHSSKQAGGGGKQGGTADSAADLAARAADAPASAASAASAAAVAPGLANGGGGQGLRLGTAIVPYLQFQNSSLTKEVPELLGDVDLLLSWATQAFGGLPEAVNLWIGDERSVTSFHHDPFENIYAVVAGSKTFTLLPPADVFRMALRQYPSATYRPAGTAAGAADAADADAVTAAVTGGAVPLRPALEPSGERVLWSSLPPGPDAAAAAARGEAAAPASPDWAPGLDLFNDPQLPPPIRVTVRAGEALYLPAMWWHQVEQEPDEAGRAIAVNYWYDMKWDAKAAYMQAVERLAQLLGLNEEPPPPPASSAAAEEEEGRLRAPYTHSRAFG